MSNLLEKASLVMIPSGYKEDVVYSEIPLDGSGDLSFTRASNGTRINSAGLVEVCPWNLAEYSNDFSSAWAPIQASKSTGFIDPIGNLNAIKLNYTTVSSAHYITQSKSLTDASAHSVYAKAGELSFLQIASAQTTDEYANFNLSTGVIGTYGSRASNVQIENVGNGWYRCSVVFTNGSNGIYLAIVQNASTEWFAVNAYSGANNTDGLYLYGAQVNQGVLKPYFPTTDRLNVPRLTYQNGGGGCPSLLLEKQSTNLCTYSEDFSNAAWNKVEDSGCSITITPNYTTASNGLPAARLVASRTNTSTLAVLVNYSPNTGTSATKSIWMKNNNAGNVTIMFGDEAVTITDSWERYSVTNTYIYAIFGLRYSGVALSCDISITGSQFELGSYPTSYIPTTSASATRVADACFKTGISSLIGQTEGTLFIDVSGPSKTGDARYMTVSDGTASNRIVIYSTTLTSIGVYLQNSSGNSALGFNTINGRMKVAFAYKNNDLQVYLNGVLKDTITSFTSSFTLNSVTVGTYEDYQVYNSLDQSVNEVCLFKTRLSNSELASLTTI